MGININESVIGKKLRRNDGNSEFDYLLCTGVRSSAGFPYVYGLAIKDDVVVKEYAPELENGLGYGYWELFGQSEQVLPPDIEPLMKEFGRHEKQTRALVAAILKVVKEK